MFVVLWCGLFGDIAYSQVSKGGVPNSFSHPSMKDSVAIVVMPPVNVDSLLKADASSELNSFRFGHAFDVNMGLYNTGTWDTLRNGDRIWRLMIRSKSAFSINLIFDEFWLPDGASFFVYSEYGSVILGAFTADVSNNPYNKFSTDLVKGDAVVLEYYEPAEVTGATINVGKVIHAYRDMFDNKKSGHGNSQSCNIDVNCTQGDGWCVARRSVAMVLLADNTRWCSACLLNNTAQDFTPYCLTAFHCADLNGNGELSQAEIDNAQTWIFRFKYWSPTCNQGDDAVSWVGLSGSTFRAGYHPTDMLLFQLSSSPLSGHGLMYSGWDRTASPAQSGAYIHHPAGDVMKISLFSESVEAATQPVGGTISWKVKLSSGVVESGSSGSPLFNQNGLVVGQHKGRDVNNFLTCNNLDAFAYAGRFNVSWTGGGTSSTRLRDWLDPDNIGVTSIGPSSPTTYLLNKTLTGTHKFAAVENIHLEGNVVTSGPECPPNSTPFTVESGADVRIKAKRIVSKPGTHAKSGSYVQVKAVSAIECSDNLVDGDFVEEFCDAGISMRLAAVEEPESDEVLQSGLEEIRSVIFPNPTTGLVTVQSSIIITSIEVFDFYGRRLLVLTPHDNSVSIDLSPYSSGIYFVRSELENRDSKTYKVVLRR